MMTLFDQEYLTGVYVKEQREEARAEAREDTQRSNVLRMNRAARQTALPRCWA